MEKTIFEKLREKAQLGAEKLIEFINDNMSLFYEKETIENEIEINVFILDNYDNTILGTYIFDNKGKFVREI